MLNRATHSFEIIEDCAGEDLEDQEAAACHNGEATFGPKFGSQHQVVDGYNTNSFKNISSLKKPFRRR